jgi:predicted amino acid dehydrogenase
VPDVLLLAKALGGGLFPLGAVLASAAWWDERFALRHSSTFANNNIACRAGLAVLEALTQGGVCEAAALRGKQLLARLHRLADRFPRLIAAVRGRGLLCAVELRPPADADGHFLSYLHHQGLYAYAVAGALAEQASILVQPTLGSTPVLRLAPPLVITAAQVDDAMDALEAAFAQLDGNLAATMLRELGVLQETPAHLNGHADNGHAELVSLPPVARNLSPQPGRFAFLLHPTRPEDVLICNPSLRHLSRHELRQVCSFFASLPAGVVMKTGVLRSMTGATAEGFLIMVPLLPKEMARRGPRRVSHDIVRAVDLAASLGAQVVGLGAYTTPYSRRGRLVVGRGPAITTGSSLTAGMTFAAVRRWLEEHELDLAAMRVAVIGAGGSVGQLCARLLARARPRRLLLIGNPRSGSGPLERLAEKLAWGPGTVQVCKDLGDLEGCALVISASGAIDPLLDEAPLAPGTMICDVARPSDTSAWLRKRPDLTIVEGGLVALPDSSLCFGPGNLLGLPDGVQLACLGETLLLGFAGIREDRGIGDDVPLAEVDATMDLAHRHGFRLAPLVHSQAPNFSAEPAIARVGDVCV